MRVLTLFASITLLSFPPTAPVNADENELFPFVISYDAPDNVTNVSAWLPKPAGASGVVRVADGRFATEAGPIRFWGTNLCSDACFPSHEDAEKVAARMARFGINCVRMHDMDNSAIWGKNADKTIINPEQLEKLDYLIYQLKQQGIYTNINLHVSRTLGDKEGFPFADQRPQYDKGIGNFEPRMIELQKKYARDLLTHVNPYTKTAYCEEPAIAMVEISNEDSLCDIWTRGDLDDLPDPYAATLRKLWNVWLVEKYGTTDKLKLAWYAGPSPLGEERLADPDFQQGIGKAWSLQLDRQSKVEASITDDGPEGQRALRLDIEQMGVESSIPQLWHARLSVWRGQSYTLSGFVRAGEPRKLSVQCMMGHDPWKPLPLSSRIKAGTDWTTFRATFVARDDDPDVLITFSDFQPGVYEFAGLSFRSGGIEGLKREQNLEDASVPVVTRGSLNLPQAARNDFIDFLWETEHDYWLGMYYFLKNELQLESLVSGTQLNYGPVTIQAKMDYLDTHSYSFPPNFPGRPWDDKNWFVRNLALVNVDDGGTLTRLASRRIADRPYTVSQYNHPAPNSYAAEGLPMIAAFGRFQKWNGIFSFAYSHNQDFEPHKITNHFDIKGDPAKLAHHIAAAALFLRGDAAEAKETVEAEISKQMERYMLCRTLDPRSLTAEEVGMGVDLNVAMKHGMALGVVEESKLGGVSQIPFPQRTSDTGQLHWDFRNANAGFFMVDTPKTKVFTGFSRGRTFTMGDVLLKLGQTKRDWATITMTAIDGADLRSPGRILLAATGDVQNTGAQIQDLGNDRITLGNNWGDAPVLCEGIDATLTLSVNSKNLRFYALDESGNRKATIPVQSQSDKTLLKIGPQYKTIWYEIEIAP